MAATTQVPTLQDARGKTLKTITWTAVGAGTLDTLIPYHAGDVILARNVHASTARTLTVTSVAERRFGRTRDINAFSLPAGGAIYVLPALLGEGWVNTSDGYIHAAGSTTDVQLAVIRLANL